MIKTNFQLMQHHKYSLTELENMLPWEREIYIALLIEHLKEEKRRMKEEQEKADEEEERKRKEEELLKRGARNAKAALGRDCRAVLPRRPRQLRARGPRAPGQLDSDRKWS